MAAVGTFVTKVPVLWPPPTFTYILTPILLCPGSIPVIPFSTLGQDTQLVLVPFHLGKDAPSSLPFSCIGYLLKEKTDL